MPGQRRQGGAEPYAVQARGYRAAKMLLQRPGPGPALRVSELDVTGALGAADFHGPSRRDGAARRAQGSRGLREHCQSATGGKRYSFQAHGFSCGFSPERVPHISLWPGQPAAGARYMGNACRSRWVSACLAQCVPRAGPINVARNASLVSLSGRASPPLEQDMRDAQVQGLVGARLESNACV